MIDGCMLIQYVCSLMFIDPLFVMSRRQFLPITMQMANKCTIYFCLSNVCRKLVTICFREFSFVLRDETIFVDNY